MIVPDGKRSGKGKALTLDRPIRITESTDSEDYKLIIHDGLPADGDSVAWIWFRLALTLEDPCESCKYLKASSDHDPVGIPKDKVDRLRYWAHVFRIVLDLSPVYATDKYAIFESLKRIGPCDCERGVHICR